MLVVGEAWQILQTPFRILRPGPVTRTGPYLRALVLHSAGENLTARGPVEDVVGGAAADSMGGVARRGEYSRLAARRVIAGAVGGLAAAALAASEGASWSVAALFASDVAALVFVIWVWLTVADADAGTTARIA